QSAQRSRRPSSKRVRVVESKQHAGTALAAPALGSALSGDEVHMAAERAHDVGGGRCGPFRERHPEVSWVGAAYALGVDAELDECAGHGTGRLDLRGSDEECW